MKKCVLAVVGWMLVVFSGCDGGLQPVPPQPSGAIRGIVHYTGNWPPADSLVDLRFVAMRFIPSSVDDFLQLDQLVYSPGLKRNVASDTFLVADVANGFFPYTVIANQYGNNIFKDWRPLGVYEVGDGVVEVRGDTARVVIFVNFQQLPVFPPQ